MCDALDRDCVGRQIDAQRLDLNLARRAFDGQRQRGGEQKSLARFGESLGDPHDVVPETHREHFVRFVEDEGLDLVEREVAFFDLIHEPARRPDDDVDTGLERCVLLVETDTTVNRDGFDVANFSDLRELMLDLNRQLPGWRKHQAAWMRIGAARSIVDVALHPLHHRQTERGGFAGAGLRLHDHVFACEHRIEHGRLHFGRVLESHRFQTTQKVRLDAHLGK